MIELDDEPRSSTVYLACCRVGADLLLKLGRTVDVRRRMSNLQTGCPFAIVDVFVVTSPYPEEVDGLERVLHRLLRHHCVCGEWYLASAEFFADLERVLERLNAADFTWNDLETADGREVEILLHRHSFAFGRWARGKDPSPVTVGTSTRNQPI